MKKIKLAIIPGDGIGSEVMDEGIKIIKHIESITGKFIFEMKTFPWGSLYYLENNIMMPEDGIEQLKEFDQILLGAVGDPRVPDHISLWGLLLPIRKEFEQYTNIRPVRLLKGVESIINGVHRKDIDMIFVRENTEGEYSGSGSWLYPGKENEVVIQNDVFSRKGTERIMQYAFELAKRENKSLTNITKSNAQNYSMVFWDQIFNETKRNYPEVKTQQFLVDAASMYMIKDPSRFEIVVTSNLFGDILTDIGAAIQGGMGLAAGANINPTGKYPSMFEAIHGSAPDIQGLGIANPLATIWAIALMFGVLEENDIERKIVEAIEQVLINKKYLPVDLGGEANTNEVGNAVVEAFTDIYNEN